MPTKKADIETLVRQVISKLKTRFPGYDVYVSWSSHYGNPVATLEISGPFRPDVPPILRAAGAKWDRALRVWLVRGRKAIEKLDSILSEGMGEEDRNRRIDALIRRLQDTDARPPVVVAAVHQLRELDAFSGDEGMDRREKAVSRLVDVAEELIGRLERHGGNVRDAMSTVSSMAEALRSIGRDEESRRLLSRMLAIEAKAREIASKTRRLEARLRGITSALGSPRPLGFDPERVLAEIEDSISTLPPRFRRDLEHQLERARRLADRRGLMLQVPENRERYLRDIARRIAGGASVSPDRDVRIIPLPFDRPFPGKGQIWTDPRTGTRWRVFDFVRRRVHEDDPSFHPELVGLEGERVTFAIVDRIGES